MDKLKECALAFEKLFNIQYKIKLGRKGKITELLLTFDKKDFHHLIGLHKLIDLPYLKKDRGKIFDAIVNEEITYEKISKSEFFEKDEERKIIGIKNRIDIFMYIEEILDNNNLIFKYNESRNGYSKIEAEYIFENLRNENIIYIFIDKNQNSTNRYCRSFFPKDIKDYTKNQTKMALLYKEKVDVITNTSNIQLDKIPK